MSTAADIDAREYAPETIGEFGCGRDGGLFAISQRYLDMKAYAEALEGAQKKRRIADATAVVAVKCSDGELEETVSFLKEASRVARQAIWERQQPTFDAPVSSVRLAFSVIKTRREVTGAECDILREFFSSGIDCPFASRVLVDTAIFTANTLMFGLLKRMNVNMQAFHRAVERGGFVAGSAALWGCVALIRGNEPTWMPNDIDVWFALGNDGAKKTLEFKRSIAPANLVDVELSRSEYRDSTRAGIVGVNNIGSLQLIFTSESHAADIVRGFSLDVCRVVWTPDDGFSLTEDRALTCVENNMITLNEADYETGDLRVARRIRMYKTRGFE